MATNKKSFYYRKDLQVTKHGDMRVSAGLAGKPFGTAVKRNFVTNELEVAATSADFHGIIDKIIITKQGNDDLTVKKGELIRCGVGSDYEFVAKGAVTVTGNKGDEVGVLNGNFTKLDATVTKAVGRIVEKFPNGEVAVLIY